MHARHLTLALLASSARGYLPPLSQPVIGPWRTARASVARSNCLLALSGGAPPAAATPVTLLITHYVGRAQREAFVAWEEGLNRDAIAELSGDGFLGATILESQLDGGTRSRFIIVLKFPTSAAVEAWDASTTKRTWLSKLKAAQITEGPPTIQRSDALVPFMEADEVRCVSGNMPARWRQMLLTWSQVFSISFALGKLLVRVRGFGGLPATVKFAMSTLLTCWIISYVSMPRMVAIAKRVGFFPQ